jgi:hypothetical protein
MVVLKPPRRLKAPFLGFIAPRKILLRRSEPFGGYRSIAHKTVTLEVSGRLLNMSARSSPATSNPKTGDTESCRRGRFLAPVRVRVLHQGTAL